MKRLLTQTLLSILFVTAAAGGVVRAQTSQRPDPPPPASDATPFGQSKVEEGNYSNAYFGLSLTLPKGWLVLNADDNKKIMDTGKELAEEGASDQRKAMLDASLKRTGFLVNAAKYQPGTTRSAEFNALFMCLAERVPTAVIKTGADYLVQMQRAMQGSSAKIELTGPPRTVQVGGVAFTVADAKTTAGPVISAQRYYVTVKKGYALVMAYTYYDEADLKTFDELLTSVKFK